MKCGSCHDRHDTVDEVRACYGQPAGEPEVHDFQRDVDGLAPPLSTSWGAGSQRRVFRPTQGGRLATDNMLGYIGRLLEGKELDGLPVCVLSAKAAYNAGGSLAFDEAGRLIDALKTLPWKPREQKSRITVGEGLYKWDGVVYKVVEARNGSGRLYAKKLVQQDDVWRFRYEPGAIGNLSPGDALSEQEAREFGKLYEICINCHRDLTDERSITAGYGPICADNLGWWYPTWDEVRDLQAAGRRQAS